MDQPIARARLNFQKVIPFDPDIHPNRIRFGEVTDILGKVNTRKACGTDNITNKIIRYLISTLHIILKDLLNICVFHSYHPRAYKKAWALMAHKPSKRRSDPCTYRPISLHCCLSKVFEAIMTKRLMSWAENTDKLPTEKSGFRKYHSTNDKLNDCLGTKFVSVLFERKKTGSNHKTSLITTVRSSLLLHLLSSFLGITFDSALTFRSHFRTVATLDRHRPLKRLHA